MAVSPHRALALRKGNQAIPPPQPGTFLIDTGAHETCVDPALIGSLQLVPKSFTLIQTPSTNGVAVQCPVYDVQLIIVPSMRLGLHMQVNQGLIPHVRSISVIGAALKSQGINGLIGRDILEQCLLVYNGQTGAFTLSW